MNFRAFWNDKAVFWEALVLSLFVHFLVLHAGEISLRFHQQHLVEIDITNMGHIGMASAKVPKPATRPKEWVKAAPNKKVVPAPIPVKPAAPAPEETPQVSAGSGSTTLSRIPQLLNLSDLNAILQRLYPEEERAAGREGTVILDLHIDTDGHVTAIDVVQSAGPAFDEAARRAVKLLRFTPAFLGSQRVPVKMRQAIQFKLEE